MTDKPLIVLILLGIGGILFFNRKRRYIVNANIPEQEQYKKKEKEILHKSDTEKTQERVEAPQKPKSKWPIPLEGMYYLPTFNRVTQLYNLPDKLLARVAFQESNFRPDIITGQTVSKAGAKGIMQIIPYWHPNVNPLDPDAAIWYAGKYLKQQFNRFGSWPLALAAYNWGPGNLSNHGFEKAPAETRNYVREITNDFKLG